MNVLYLGNTLDPASGWGRFSRELITRFVDSGVVPTVLMEKNSGFPGEQVVLRRSWGSLLSAVHVRHVLKNNTIDLVHSLEVNPYGISAELGRTGMDTKHVITATGAYSVRPLYDVKTSALTKRAYRRADEVVCISGYVEKEISKKVRLPNSSVIPLGVDFEKFSGARIPATERFILSVGNLSKRKGYHISIAAFAEVARTMPDLKYYIAGSVESSMLALCSEIIEKENLQDRVVFLGSVNDAQLKELYLSAELFLLTSINDGLHFEGFGLVFLEAASAGLPVIGTTNNGIEDAMRDGQNGFLVSQEDIHATAKAILKILSDEQLKKSFASNSIKWAKENTWSGTVNKYLEVYNRVLYG